LASAPGQIGGSGWEFGWGEQDDKQSVAAIHRALDLGVNWVDTAAVYGMGHSEEVVASALSTWPGPRPYVFTKCGLRWDDQGYVHRNLKANSIRRESEESLRRRRNNFGSTYQLWQQSPMLT
jgi:aryl-alcohol dehydrogenase-like predicted oxidoreductase